MPWQSLIDFLRIVWPSLVGALKIIMAGKVAQDLQKGRQVREDLSKLDEVARAVSDNRARSTDERLRDARKRGLYRVRPEQTKH
ncbi:hypothetical protein [Agrobacterium tumefaciens]|uniref:Uncharacterized protein n=1 Tax=Agrobacterium tumefaciens TaxID=358 RepID=A0A176WXV0_AGRTU|nr:hypothetical protein [Agrobacterium tumefaciens]OAE37630.1 hypothetical protein A7J57_08615 [Agrobacterium tumefaciens]